MTMHLAKGLTTLRTNKPKVSKLTKAQQERFAEEHRQYNKRMKQQGRHNERMTFDEYVDRVYGVPYETFRIFSYQTVFFVALSLTFFPLFIWLYNYGFYLALVSSAVVTGLIMWYFYGVFKV